MSSKFGAVLKTAREEQNISLAEIAEALKLSIEKITAIEEGDVSSLPPAAFTCGYLRLFSKVVKVDEESVIEQYYAEIGEVPDGVLLTSTSDIPVQASSGHPGMLVASVIIALIIVILIFNVFLSGEKEPEKIQPTVPAEMQMNDSSEVLQGQSESIIENTESDTSTEETDVKQVEISNAVAVSSEMNVDEKSSKQLPVAENNDIELKNDVKPDENNAADNLTVVSDSIDPVSVDDQDGVVLIDADRTENEERANEIIKRARMASPVAEVGVDTIALIAKEDCWVEIADANDHLLYFSLLKKGEEAHLSGQEPFEVFLGNADAVELKLNDNLYTVSEHIRSNRVARFTMSMETLRAKN